MDIGCTSAAPRYSGVLSACGSVPANVDCVTKLVCSWLDLPSILAWRIMNAWSSIASMFVGKGSFTDMGDRYPILDKNQQTSIKGL